MYTYRLVYTTGPGEFGLLRSFPLTCCTSAENGEHQKLKFCTQMASILHAKGAVVEPRPFSVPVDSSDAPSWANRTTARCFAHRSREELGWKPKTLLEDVFEAEILDILTAVQSA